MGKTIGAKITQDRYLDKNQLKKLNAKKCEAMFPAQNAANSMNKSQFRVLIEDTDLKNNSFQKEEAFDRRNLSVSVNHANDESQVQVRSPISPKKKRLRAAGGSLNPIKKGGYQEMMQDLS